jgi:hypothetical protein
MRTKLGATEIKYLQVHPPQLYLSVDSFDVLAEIVISNPISKMHKYL